MPEMTYVKPVEGRTVMEPRTKMVMPAEGMFVSLMEPHWMAHLRFGDIEEADAPKEAEAAKPDAPSPEEDAKTISATPIAGPTASESVDHARPAAGAEAEAEAPEAETASATQPAASAPAAT